MRKIQLLTAFLVLLAHCAGAQTKGLKVGGEFRNVVIPKTLNGNQRSLQTDAFKDRLLIIDFWATSCPGCVAALPKMQALQKQFNQQIKIMPVTFEPEALVTSFWKQNAYTRTLTIPVGVEETKLHALFPHEVIPHEIWIYKGKVIGITTEEYVDEFNIKQVLNGKMPNWPIKDDYYMFDAQNGHIFVPDEKQIDVANTKISYVATCGYMEKDGASAAGPFGNSGVVKDSVNKTIRTYYINQSIYNIYQMNWQKVVSASALQKPSILLRPNQVVWEVADPIKYMHHSAITPMINTPYLSDWQRKHAICFEAQYLDTGQKDADIARKIIADLNWLLGLNVRWEKRKEKVMVVYAAQPGAASPSKKSGNQMRLSELVSQLNDQPENPYVYNETAKGSDPQLMVNISSWKDFAAVKKTLQENGFDLKEEERTVDKFVFSEIDGGLVVDAEKSKMMRAQLKAQENMAVPSAAEGSAFLEENKNKKGVTTLASGLQYEVLKMGDGPKPALTDKVVTDFTGKFINGKIFDSSYLGGLVFSTKLTDVLSGWTEALQLMPVGSEWRIYLPADLAYGNVGSTDIPPGSVLVFDIKLIKIQ